MITQRSVLPESSDRAHVAGNAVGRGWGGCRDDAGPYCSIFNW
jgi:hypothetical protein